MSSNSQSDRNREEWIARLKEEIARQEQSGQFHTVHHEMLQQILSEGAAKTAVVKQDNKEKSDGK